MLTEFSEAADKRSDELETVSDKGLEIGAVIGGETGVCGHGRPGDHGIDPKGSFAASLVEQVGGLASLFFIEGNDLQ